MQKHYEKIGSSRVRLAIGSAGALAVVGGTFGAAAIAAPSDPVKPAPAPSVQAAATHFAPAPGRNALADGETLDLTSVIGPEGTPVGHLAPAATHGDQPIRLGTSEVEFRGREVVDASGKLTGYLISGDNGFVSLEEVADPVALAEIEKVWVKDRADQEAEPTPEMIEARERGEAVMGLQGPNS